MVKIVTVFDAKMIPISVSSRVGVYSEEEVVLVVVNFNGTVKVSVFKGTVKWKFIGRDGRIHSFKRSVEEGGAVVIVVSESLLSTPRSTFM